jgi:hypothetical protein
MVVPASFVFFTESGRAAFLPASDAIKRVGLVPFSATVRALASIVDTQLLLAQVASVVEVQEGVLDNQLAREHIKREN